jgi:hypothetical protein
MKFPGLGCGAAIMVLWAGGACADTSHEFWPELDSWIRLNPSTRLLLTTEGTRDRDGDRTNSAVEGYVDYRYSDRISYRAGYYYSNTPPAEPGDAHSIERRWVLDFNYHWKLDEATTLTNRVRTDLRDIAGDSSYRFRDRLKLEHETHLGRQAVNPYGNLEAYYDTRYDTVSRYRLEFGATTPLSKDIEVDLYVGRQRDTQPIDKYSNGIGVTLSLYLQ